MGERVSSPGIGLSVAAAVGSVVFGDFAQDISQWAVCAHSDSIGEPCKDAPRTQALAIGTFISTMVAIIGTAAAAVDAGKEYKDALVAILAALVGALFSLLKASVSDKGYPNLELMGAALLIYILTVSCVATPILRSFKKNTGFEPTVKSIFRWSSVLLIAFSLGGVLQIIAEIFWQGSFDRYSSRKFILAPTFSVSAIALFSAMIVWACTHSQSSRQKGTRALFICTVATVIAATYGATSYFNQHGMGTGWMMDVPLGRGHAAIMFVGLTCPTIIAVAISHLISKEPMSARALTPFVVFAMALAALTAYFAGEWRAQASVQSSNDITTLVLVHVSVPILALASIRIANRISQFSILKQSLEK